MKLSESVMLGSTQIKLSGDVYMGRNCGCLLGMGMKAQGVDLLAAGFVTASDQENEIAQRYPWIMKLFTVPKTQRIVSLPSEATGVIKRYSFVRNNTEAKAKDIISLWAIMVAEGVATIEQAVDWIRENEPQETEKEAPQTNMEEPVCVLAKQ
jgi:hypothetical protein